MQQQREYQQQLNQFQQQQQNIEQPPLQSTLHPQMLPTEREVTGVYVPQSNVNKRNEQEVTGNPPDKKGKKKKRVSFSEKPQIDRETMPYSVVSDMMHLKSNITIAQLLTIPQYQKELKKALTPKRRTIKRKGKGKDNEMLTGVASLHTPMMCKGQVSSWTIDIIIDSGSSISIISKAFADHIN
jgi:hypothetical protein